MAAFFWALGASLYRKAIHDMNAIRFNLIRSTSVAIYAFLLLSLLRKWSFFFNLDFNTITIMGISTLLVLVAGDSLYFIGLRTIGVTKTVPITYSYSILVVLLSAIILDEAITLLLLLGTAAIIVGVWLIANKTLDQNQKSGSSLIGVLASVGTIFCWGFGIVFFKLILNNNDPYILTAGRMLFLIPTLAVLSIIPHRKKIPRKKLTKTQISLALLSGLIALGFGDTLLYLGLDSTNINIIAPLTSITPIFSAIIAIIFLGEKVSKKTIIATLLVTIGTMLLFF
jgi:DME family drug/metabolite transporter